MSKQALVPDAPAIVERHESSCRLLVQRFATLEPAAQWEKMRECLVENFSVPTIIVEWSVALPYDAQRWRCGWCCIRCVRCRCCCLWVWLAAADPGNAVYEVAHAQLDRFVHPYRVHPWWQGCVLSGGVICRWL